jgi:hypothetical protein
MRNLQFEVPGVSISETPTLHHKYYKKLPEQHVCSTQHSYTEYLACLEGNKLSAVITCNCLKLSAKSGSFLHEDNLPETKKKLSFKIYFYRVDLSGSFPNFSNPLHNKFLPLIASRHTKSSITVKCRINAYMSHLF